MLTYFVVVPILIAVFLYLFHFKTTRVIAIVVQLAIFVASGYLFLMTQGGDYFITNVGNHDSVLGIMLRADNLSSVFILLSAFVFLIAAIYSFHEYKSRLFWFLLFLWEGLLIGVFLTRDFFNVFVLMEGANVVVAVLIMYHRDKRSMYDGVIYLMVNIVVMQFYLFGLGYLYMLTGALDMDAVGERIGALDRATLFLPYALIMTFVGLKCALVPLFHWLPKAHGTPGAPSAISAVLSGLHIKSGVYMFLRFQDVFSEVAASHFFLAIGIASAIVGVVMALAQTDIKLILAYSTIAQVGLIITGLNIPDSYTHIGSLYYIINHTLFKSALFLSAGMIIKISGTRDITKIRGVLRHNPVIGIATVMACLGIIGTPFFGGSVSKYFMMANVGLPLTIVMIIINLGTILVFIRFSQILFGTFAPHGKVERPDRGQLATTFVLGVSCLALGVLGEQVIEFLFGVRASVDFASYVEKMAIFAVSLVAGYFITKMSAKTTAPLRALMQRTDLGFRGICVSIGAFFAMVLLAARLL